MDTQQIMAWDQQHYMRVFNRYPVVLSHGEGPYLVDGAGKRYLDFLAGIAVNLVGHGHPVLVKAIADQAAKLIHCSNLYYTQPQALLAKRLAEASGLERVFMANSGAEANEGAIKLARKYGKQSSEDKVEIITAVHGFHGRTIATLTATAQPQYQQGFEPLPVGFRYVPYNDVPALAAAISERTCAVFLEPIQGEGGVNVPQDDYFTAVRELCDKHGALLVLDEIQTGMGRTGTLFAFEQTGIKPDIITLAKGLGGGVPIGALLASEKVAAAFSPGDHGSTFGGNPLACAAANAVLDIIAAEDLLGNTRRIGEYFQAELRKLQEQYPTLVATVRGQGLILGMELQRPGRDIVNRCLELGAIINCTAGNVLRFVPPLNITVAHIDELMAVLKQVFAEQVA